MRNIYFIIINIVQRFHWRSYDESVMYRRLEGEYKRKEFLCKIYTESNGLKLQG
jgi:hypothetical protein